MGSASQQAPERTLAEDIQGIVVSRPPTEQVQQPLSVSALPQRLEEWAVMTFGPYWVRIVVPGREQFLLSVNGTETIEMVKCKIQDLTGLPADTQCLVFGEETMDDECTLMDYMITPAAAFVHPICVSSKPVMMVPMGVECNALIVTTGKGEMFPASPRHKASRNALHPWKRRIWDRRVLFVNRTYRRVTLFVFPGQEKHIDLQSLGVPVPTPLGSIGIEGTANTTRTPHSGAWEPSVFQLQGLPLPANLLAPSAVVVPAFHVFLIPKNTNRRAHYVVTTLESSFISVWAKDDIEGGYQLDIQHPLFGSDGGPEAQPLLRKCIGGTDGSSDALKTVVRDLLVDV